MLPKMWRVLLAVLAVGLLISPVGAADLTSGMKEGTPELKSSGPIAFGPEGLMFVGDPQGAAIYAIATGDTTPTAAGPVKIANVDEKIATLIGAGPKDILINDMVVNPASGRVYFAVANGKGPSAKAVLVRTDSSGKMECYKLDNVKYSKASLPNASDRQRQESITQIGYVKGQVIVAGLSNEDFASKLRVLEFPFSESGKGSSVEIFHGAHGKFETNAPVRTFTTYEVAGECNVMAAYTCTPLVRFPLSQLKPGEKVKGTTVAELGNRNKPLDMFVYQKDGKDYILMANSSRGMMKINMEGVDKIEGIVKPVTGGGTAGLKYDTITEMKGVMQLAKLDKEHALVLTNNAGAMNVDTVPLP